MARSSSGGDVDSGCFHELFRVERLVAAEELSEGFLHPLLVAKARVRLRVISHVPTVQAGSS